MIVFGQGNYARVLGSDTSKGEMTRPNETDLSNKLKNTSNY